jgi:hypothetical protein
MKTSRLHVLVGILAASFIGIVACGIVSAAESPKRLKRADSFLGIHFDFHAGDDCKEIGRNVTREMIENIINLVHPDYLQIDCKGHRGLSSYPTKAGNQAPGFVGDPLRLWRQVTAERGVALYMHYSGVWDSEAIRRNPEWAALGADGKSNGKATSAFGPYVDKLLVPQLRELAGEYGVDGVWIDGDCWAAVPDYSEAALNAFREATGIQDVPRKPGDPHWFEFLQFHREAYRRYVRHTIAEVKKTHPDFQICSNWAFTDHMPEPVSAPVDFISGDYSPDDSVNSARLSARYLVRQGKPWDLMAWSFSRGTDKKGMNQKTAVQLQREAAVVLSVGGGFQAYFKQKRDGSIFDERMPVMAEVAKFCRARQAICHHAVPVPQVAMLYSTAGNYRRINGLFNRDLGRMQGILQALLESQQSVELLGEHQLTGRMGEYPLIVLPEWDYLEPKFIEELVAYVKNGGNLLVIGPKTATLFAAQLNLQADPKAPELPAVSIVPLGKGRIAAVHSNFGQEYLRTRDPKGRQALNDLVRTLFPKPLVEVKGSHDLDVAVNRINGKLAVNLVNTAGPHADKTQPIIESIPPVGPLEIGIRMEKKPARVTSEPGAQPLTFEYNAGRVWLTLPKLEIHSIIVVE